jgi:hypothetical protein
MTTRPEMERILAEMEAATRRRLPPGPNTIATLLQQAGLFALPLNPGPDAVEVALRTLRELMNGADSLRMVSVRRATVVLLNDRGVKYADRLVGAAFKLGEDDMLDEGTPATPNADELFATARQFLEAPDILRLVGKYVTASGYAGDTAAPRLVYLALTSRLQPRPVNLFLSGPSAGGKNYTVRVVLPLFPDDAYYAVAGMSPLAVMYNEESFAHRIVVVSEASAFHTDGIGATLLRGLAWDAELRYDTVIEGEAVHLYKPGPTGLITTGTRRLEAELSTRLWTVPVPDDPEHTRRVVQANAVELTGSAEPEQRHEPWQAAQRWLAVVGERRVIVPFASTLADLVPVHEVRMRRDFTQLLTLVQAHALLHQCTRKRDAHGRIVATMGDYEAVYELVRPVFAASLSGGLTPEVRRLVQTVASFTAGSETTVTVSQVARQLGLATSTCWRRIKIALDGRWLVNDEQRKHQPAKLRIGEPLPDEPGLPIPAEVVKTWKRTMQPVVDAEDERFQERFHGAGDAMETDPDEAARAAQREGA